MKHAITYTLIFVMALGSLSGGAQTLPDSLSLQGQYQTMLRKSRTQQYYKLINPDRLSSLWRSTMDTLSAERKKVKNLEARANLQTSRIDSQETSLNEQKKRLEASLNQVDEIGFLGIPLKKSAYNMIMWGLVLVLAGAFTFVFLKSSGHRREARMRIQQAGEIAQELQAFKIRANEREKKLARELQDERNKLDELTKR
jgi:septal ring factor EnvC (AmiA/AmiB activator)